MERVFLVNDSEGGVGRSLGATSHLDEFEMTSRKVSLVESNWANPNVGNSYQKGVIPFLLVSLGVSEVLNLYGAPEKIKVTVQSTLEKSQPRAATDSGPSRTRLRARAGPGCATVLDQPFPFKDWNDN
jgi:hypothetical protein